MSTDTSCDIFRNELKARKIAYRPLVYTIDDKPYMDEFTVDEDYKAFYAEVRSGKMPTTSQINVVEHEEFFESLLGKQDGDILHITLSSGLSSTYASACLAAETVNAKYGKRVYVVDSLGATITVRHVVDKAQEYRDAGYSAEEASQKLAEYTSHLQTWFMPTDLMHLKRGGRVSGPAAYIGTALKIKPILFINKVGGLSVVDKKIGVTKALNAMANAFARDCSKNAQKVYIASADSDYAEEFRDKIKALRPDCDVEIGWIGPVIGAHTGSGAVGLSFYSDKTRVY
ncbi:MAG: DegV family protein [Clostridiales bacterium]|nr:DegV family protein [Clostridiales bacterium]